MGKINRNRVILGGHAVGVIFESVMNLCLVRAVDIAIRAQYLTVAGWDVANSARD